VPVVEREIAAAADRLAAQRARQQVAEMEKKHRALIGGSQEAVCYSQDGMHNDVNASYLALFGYAAAEELDGIPVLNLIDKTDQARFKEYLRKPDQSKDAGQAREFTAIKGDGSKLSVEIRITRIQLDDGQYEQIAVTDITARKAIENKLLYMNQHDPLTGLLNRQSFVQDLNKAIEAAKTGKTGGTLLYLDLHGLHEINAKLGHAAGDRLLLQLSKVFREKTGPQDILARFSGHEFAVLLTGKTPATSAATAEAILQAIKAVSVKAHEQHGECSAVSALVAVTKDSGNAQQVLAEALKQCVDKRPAGSTAPQAASPALHMAAPAAATGHTATPQEIAQVKQALAKGRIQLLYQPIVNLFAEASEMYEVYARILDEQGNQLTAAEFMPAVEAGGLQGELDRWVTRRALGALADLHKGGRHTTLFVNLSPQTVRDETFVDFVRDQLSATGAPSGAILFDIAEQAFIDYPEDGHRTLDALRHIGISIALDDFGAQYGALRFLQSRSVAYVKLAGALIENLMQNEERQALVRTFAQTVKALDKKLVAKFVDGAETLSTLWNFQVDYVQGNYFQAAEAQLNYDFGGGETLSSDTSTAASWASR
jgi:diguanylate cyclase (GGDEF)-like protein/PAS domain S-box-containing protein